VGNCVHGEKGSEPLSPCLLAVSLLEHLMPIRRKLKWIAAVRSLNSSLQIAKSRQIVFLVQRQHSLCH
jgi:hypothetical protein